ncbi:PTS ascorbate transporter subunit IIC [Mediterraneibacter sp. NSJ-55]|uniref:Ascorbate-specific PTS system EIIC component n=1 Tax=Mediterraneibacter hominis TaxID=2763054 RepID=A0A923LHI9_9FIRM|nr:PTS ascorbate transporter subunit IIC [Mediterraneibacter hominis]MBC5688888.1 PTS ascorbate transporter subunit IIC [Mediterraneibacter hominis]
MNTIISILTSVISQAAVLVALISFIGLVAQRASIERTMTGTLKTFLGFLIMGQGSNIITGMLDPLNEIMMEAFHIQGVIPVNEAITAMASEQYGTKMAFIAFFGLIINILLARFTKFKYIFLSGHHTIIMAALTAVMLSMFGLPTAGVIAIGAIVVGIMSVLTPAISMPFVRKITGGETFALGHWATTGYIFSGFIGKIFGKNPEETSTEKMELPKWMGFFKEPVILMGIGVFIIEIICCAFAGSEFVANYAGTTHMVVWALMQGFIFSAGVSVILLGVRMILAELVPAFKGIAERIVPNAIPALDCPTVFTFAPNAIMVGFIGYTIGQFIAFGICLATGMTVIIPTLLHSFFMGGTAAIFANATGGRRGAVIGSLLTGVLNNMLCSLLFPAFAALGFAGTTFADTDFSIIGLIFYGIAHLLGVA